MIKLISTPSKVMKNEKGAYLWKVSNGYRMSRKAKTLLGINADEAGKLGIGSDESGNLLIKHDSTKGEYNCSVSKLNVITNTGVVEVLESYGIKFEIQLEEVDGFRIMKVVEEIVDDKKIEELKTCPESVKEELDSLEVTEEDAFLS